MIAASVITHQFHMNFLFMTVQHAVDLTCLNVPTQTALLFKHHSPWWW